ncbi:peptidoglycan-binding domain-containing protein [Hahella sp. NBU794]|uniref:peptidoglycan-binding domain-containing protein n=1 Tax=Hahella sp. NBU794 TaxID=3422590 RepID=UPI003D6F3538
MTITITSSVGINGANRRNDVAIIQALINAFDAWKTEIKPLTVDGKIGNKSIHAIKEFQKQAIGIRHPDGRVDPNGKTFRYLTMYLSNDELSLLETSLFKGKEATLIVSTKKIQSFSGLSGQTVTYKSTLPKDQQLVSNYAISVIKIALKEAGMSHAVITSTLRTPSEQAKLMYKNAKLNLKKQYALYGRNGDKVLDIYDSNKEKSESDIISLMEDEIVNLEKAGKRVSKHCVSESSYKTLNVFDIGYNSTKSASKNFNKEKFHNALSQLNKDGYISQLIDETNKSNKCWHIEIIPNNKALPIYDKGSILNPIKYINGLC